MRNIIFLFFTFLIVDLEAQIVLNKDGRLTDEESYFNERFLSDNKIKAITGRVSIKKELQPITDIGIIHRFEFNENGKLTSKIKTFNSNHYRSDTSLITYKYDDISQLVNVTTNQHNGFYSYDYEYDEEGRIKSESYYRGKNLSYTKYELEKGRKFLIKSEDFTYEKLTEQRFKKYILNSDGKAYKEVTYVYNDFDNLIEESSRFIITNRRQESLYYYDEEGRLSKIEKTSNISTPVAYRYEYSYDELGNIFEELTFKNDELITKRQFLYEQESMLLKAELIKNENTQDIKIIQFNYEYFDYENDSTVIGN